MVPKIFITKGGASLCTYSLQNIPLSVNCFFSHKFPARTKHSCKTAFSGFDIMFSRGRENSKNYSAANLKITKVLTFPHSHVLTARLKNMKSSDLMNLNIRVVFCFTSKLKKVKLSQVDFAYKHK